MKVACALLVALQSCSFYTDHRHPTYAAAAAHSGPVGDAKVFRGGLPANFPIAVYYAWFECDFAPSYEDEQQRWAARHAKKAVANPDAIVLLGAGDRLSGVSVQTIGTAVVAVPLSRPAATAHCFRLLPTQLGFECNASCVVTRLSGEARASGMLEGDVVTHVAGRSFALEANGTRECDEALLQMRPGNQCEVSVVRAGSGSLRFALTAR